MFGMTHTATLFRSAGQKNGKPAHENTGMEFACRAEPTDAHTLLSRGIASASSVTLYTEPMDVHTGDRIVLNDGRAYIAREVQRFYGLKRLHHLEILALSETEP